MRSDMASTAPKAQQEPQGPWSRTWPMEVHLAQLVRASKDAIYFTFSDRSAQEKLGIYREERQ